MKIYDILKIVSSKREKDTDIVRDTGNYGHNVNICVSCGDIIPEGFQVCSYCIARVNNK